MSVSTAHPAAPHGRSRCHRVRITSHKCAAAQCEGSRERTLRSGALKGLAPMESGVPRPNVLMHGFLQNNRDELIARCKAKVAERPKRAASTEQLANGVPLFLSQLTRTLLAEEDGKRAEGVQISGPAGGDADALSEIGVSAAAHGRQLLELGYSVDQVVHDYGDLCQSITDLAFERDAPFAVDEFRTLNRCLDNAIADAVTAFVVERDVGMAIQQSSAANERLGFLAHELRNSLQIAMVAFRALETGPLGIGGSTGALLKKSLVALSTLVNRSLAEVRSAAGETRRNQLFSLASFVAEARNIAALDASERGSTLVVLPVDPQLAIKGDRGQLLAALLNLLQNALKFTRPHTEVTLKAYAVDNHVFLDVEDHCGGLAPGISEGMFMPFAQAGTDKSGLGLGLSIARKSAEADGGTVRVRDRPGIGCVLTLSLPRHTVQAVKSEPSRAMA